jgi:putative cell wall-binding protein
MMSEMAGSRRRWRRATAAASTAAIGAGLVVVPADPASAATLTVTDPGDSGPNTLRGKVAAATDGDVIEFDPSIMSITLVTGAILLDKSLTIRGPGADALTIDGGSNERVFFAYNGASTPPVDVTISQVTLTHGLAAVGGAVYAKGEDLTLTDVAIVDNVSTGNGGGVALLGSNGASLTIEGSTITLNRADDNGGGISMEDVTAPVTITDSTISTNRSGMDPGVPGRGGGIWAKKSPPTATVLRIEQSSVTGNFADPDVSAAGQGGGVYAKYIDVTLVDSTVSANTADRGAGLFLTFNADAVLESTTIAGNVAASMGGGIDGPGGTVTMRNTVIADNTAPTNPDLVANTVTATYSLVEVDETPIAGADGNLTGDPVLGPLTDNGGPTATELPGATSPLIDSGDPAYTAPPSTDQRGQARVQGDAIDIGSVETTPASPAPAPQPAPPASVTVGVPPPGPDGSSTVDVSTYAGTVTIELPGGGGAGATVTVTVKLADDVPTRGFTVLGRVYEVDVDGAGSGGGALCLPYEPGADPDPARTPVIVHLLPDGTRQALPTAVRGGQLCAFVTSFSPFAIALFDTTRLAGVDAASTAAAISASAFEPGVPTAYVVARSRTGDAVAAGAAGGPVLLVDQNGVPDATAAELRRLAPRRIVVVGGTGAVSDAVVARLGATRVAGRDRYETSAALAEDAHRPGVPVVYVVNGSSVADGLVAAAAASHDGGVVLLVERDVVPAAVGAAIKALRPARAVAVGGTAAVSDAVVAALGATRIAGADRYATSANVARAVGDDDLAVARGDEPTDALAGASLGRPLLLVARDALPPPVLQALAALVPRSITILGGTAAVSLDTEAAVADYLP